MTPEDLLAFLDGMIEQQRQKVLALARDRIPDLTWDDVLNSDGYPVLQADTNFNYQDGILAGLISAQIALRARLRGAVPP